jgi:hypothetical protein
MKYIGLISVIVCLSLCSKAQDILISGTVLDSTRRFIVPAVKVSSTSGHFTYTDSSGSYNILVNQDDSINFTYRNKSTVWFPVRDIKYGYPFDISLQVNMGDKYNNMLREVIVIKKSYKQDSLEFREKYAKTFNSTTGGLRMSDGPSALYGGTPGLDPNEIINMFRFRRNRSLRVLQNRLLDQEQEKFINYRFSKSLVKRITGLKDGRDLETFMKAWRPDYEFAAYSTEIEFHTYILEAYRSWKQGILPSQNTEDNK